MQHTHTALLQRSGPVLMKLLFLKGAEHELCRFVFTWGVFLLLHRVPLSQLFSIPPLTFLHSLFHSFKPIFSFSNTSIFFTLNHVFEISVSLPACSCTMPPGSPRFSFSALCCTHYHFLHLFIFVLMLHTLALSLFFASSLCIPAYLSLWMECLAEERKRASGIGFLYMCERREAEVLQFVIGPTWLKFPY